MACIAVFCVCVSLSVYMAFVVGFCVLQFGVIYSPRVDALIVCLVISFSVFHTTEISLQKAAVKRNQNGSK